MSEASNKAMNGHADIATLEAGLEHIRAAPAKAGELKMVVRRPATNEREVLEEAELCTERGLDDWLASPEAEDMNGDGIIDGLDYDLFFGVDFPPFEDWIAGPEARWQLAGDQLYVDLDLSEDNVPPGTRLAIGSALVEVTDQPHLGCQKFRERFGDDALRFVNSDIGRQLHLRGINARVVEAGTIRLGERVEKLD